MPSPPQTRPCMECGLPLTTESKNTKCHPGTCAQNYRYKEQAKREALIATDTINGSGPNPGQPDPWQRPADVPPEEPARIPRNVLSKERPPESQAVVPIWPTRGIFVDSDHHFPIADPCATAAKLAFVRDMKPSLWLNLGDYFDFWLASRYEKEASRLFGGYGATLQDEIESGRPYANAVCSVVDQAHFIPGNHERRHEAVINANPSMHGLRSLGWKAMLEYPANFYAHPYGTRLRVNRLPLYAVHGDQIVPERVVAPAMYMLNRRVNQTTLFGHTHKAQIANRTGYDENRAPITYAAINTGHGSLTAEQRYAGPEPDWQHAFVWIDCFEADGHARFSVHLVTIIDGRFSWGGKLYDGRKWQ